jgi:hypothetical protein
VVATASRPPFTKSQSIDSAAQTRPTSSTVDRSASSRARTPAVPPAVRAKRARDPGSSAVTQPPLRPEAP